MSQSHTSDLPALSRVQVGGTTLWVPPTWRKHISANARLQSQTTTFAGQLGQLTLTRYRFTGFLPLTGNVPPGTFLPERNGPYIISWHLTIAEQPTYIAKTTLPSGAGLTLQLLWKRQTHKTIVLSRRMLAHVRFPAPLTVTQAVARLRRSSVNQTASSLATITQRILDRQGRNRAWLFVSGAPLADMTAWTPSYLFQTINGGKTWHVINYACSGEFETGCTPPGHQHLVGQATPVAMQFLSPSVGILAQANRMAPILNVYRTTDGGRQWTRHHYRLPNLPHFNRTATPPKITETSTGLLSVTVAIQGHPAHVMYGSANQGRTWHVLPRVTSQST